MSCLKFKAIPKLSCKDAILDADGSYIENALSILRVIRNLSTTLDTPSLSTVYGFQADGTKADITGIAPTTDLTLVWTPSAVDLSAPDDVVDISNGCITGDDVTPDSEVKYYISYYYAALTAERAVERAVEDTPIKWISRPLLCCDSEPAAAVAAALRGPVSFANPRVGGHGMPPFIPRSGGGGGDEGDQDDCTPDSVKVKVYNAGEEDIEPYTPVIFTGKQTTDGARGCIPWNEEQADNPWGVLLPVYGPDVVGDYDPDANATEREKFNLKPAKRTEDKDNPDIENITDADGGDYVTGCCVILGVVNIPFKLLKTVDSNNKQLTGKRITPIPLADGTGDEIYILDHAGQAALLRSEPIRVPGADDPTAVDILIDRSQVGGVPLTLARYISWSAEYGHLVRLLSLDCNGMWVEGEEVYIKDLK